MAVKVLLCYAHEDERLSNKLVTHLVPLRHEELIDLWQYRDISAGVDWEWEIDKRLNTAQIILLLISPDFLASDYCYSIEMKRALERHERGEALVIPIILRPTAWQKMPFLSTLQALPKDGKPISTWRSRDSACVDVVNGLHKAMEEVSKQNKAFWRTETEVVDYLVIATNKMYDLLFSGSPENDDFASAASVGCTTLRLLADDQEFKSYVTALSESLRLERNNFYLITHQEKPKKPLAHFLDFLKLERNILIASGINPLLVDEIVKQARLLIQDVRNWQGDVDALFIMIAEIRDNACTLSDSLKKKKDEDTHKDETRKHLQNIMYAVSGAAVIALNFANPLLSLSHAGTTVSAAVGGALIHQAASSVQQ